MGYILICIHTDQSELPHNDQSECVILTNQDCAIWTNQNSVIWIPHLHKHGPIRNWGGTFLYKRCPTPRGCSSQFAKCSLQSLLLLLHLRFIRSSCWQWDLGGCGPAPRAGGGLSPLEISIGGWEVGAGEPSLPPKPPRTRAGASRVTAAHDPGSPLHTKPHTPPTFRLAQTGSEARLLLRWADTPSLLPEGRPGLS